MKNQRKMGVILAYLSQGIHIIAGLIYTPIMLRLLGQSEYGLYQLVSSVVSYLGILNFGFSASYIRFYSRSKAASDDEGIAKLNGMFMTIFLCISLICLCCGSVMVANITMIFGDGLSITEYKTARMLMLLMVFNMALSFPNSVLESIVMAHERFIFQKLLSLFQNLFSPFITLPLLLAGYGSVAMVLVSTILMVGKVLLNLWFCKNKLYTKFIFRDFNFSLLKEMWIFTFYIFINMIIDQINWNLDKILLGRIAGTIAVAVYGVGGQLNSLYISVSTTISSVFAPKVNRIVSMNDDNKELTRLFIKIGRIQYIVMALVLTGFIFFGEFFIQMWAGEGYEASYRIALLLIIPVTIPSIQNIGIEIQRAKNMHKARSIVYLCIAMINVLISIPCIFVWKEEGAAFGTAVSLFLGNGIFMNWYYHKKIGIDIILFWKNIIRLSCGLIIPIVIGGIVKNYIYMNNIMEYISYIAVYTIVYGISMFKLGMNEEEKQLILKPIHLIFKR